MGEEKGRRKGRRGSDDSLDVEQNILKEVKKQDGKMQSWYGQTRKNAYDMTPLKWIIESLKMFKISEQVVNFII